MDPKVVISSYSSYCKETVYKTTGSVGPLAYYQAVNKTKNQAYHNQKTQVDMDKSSQSTSGTNSVTNYTSTINNYAGYYTKGSSTYGSADTLGTYYWLSSPYTGNTDFAWSVGYVGYFGGDYVYDSANGVAPAFCI